MHRTPEISVLMPTFNNEKYLSTAIDSVLDQSFSDFELILIDDSSTDNTAAILQDYQNKDKRIRVLTNPQNKGVAYSLNSGLEKACGKYIARMDGDDISFPHRFQTQFEFMESHPDIGVLGSQLVVIDEDGNPAPEFKWEQPTSPALTAWHLLYATPLCHPAIMLRTQCLQEVQGYDENYANEDSQLYTRLVFRTRLKSLDETLIYYRMPTKTQVEKSRRWEPHVHRVGREYAERILNRQVPGEWFKILFDFVKHGQIDTNTDLHSVFQITSLLRELFSEMKRQNIIEETGIEEVEKLLISQTQRLILVAYKTVRYN